MKTLKVIGKITYIGLLLMAFGICTFLFYAYAHLLDFFPWGNNNAYVIWEPLVDYFILPSFFAVGVIKVLASSKNTSTRRDLLFLTVGLMLSLPPIIGFDLATDLAGRWTGVITALLSVLLTIYVIYREISTFSKR